MISVIIPTYNRAHFLAEAIRSVLNQEYFRESPGDSCYELWVVDDGSTDQTGKIVRSFGNKVKYFFQEHRGVSAARNRGLSLVSGEFVAFLDSDDIWLEKKIRSQMSFMAAYPRAMVCYTEEIWVRNGVLINPQKKHRKYSGWIFDKVLPLCLLSLSSALFRKKIFETVGHFDENLPACEDYDLGVRIAHGFPIHLIDRPLIVKRGGHPDQLSKKYWGMDRFRVSALEKALELSLRPEQERLVKQEMVKKCLILARGFMKRSKRAEAEKYYSLARKYGLQGGEK
jgi:glycosyltransferase involved in cell wall biosynthesis